MSSERCQAETAEGTQCKHSASRGEYCHIHDPDDAADVGREPRSLFDFEDDEIEKCLAMASDGLSHRQCALALGLDRPSFERLLDRHPEFRASFRRARASGAHTLVRDGTQHARWLLAVSYGMGADDEKGTDPARDDDQLPEIPEPDHEARRQADEALNASG